MLKVVFLSVATVLLAACSGSDSSSSNNIISSSSSNGSAISSSTSSSSSSSSSSSTGSGGFNGSNIWEQFSSLNEGTDSGTFRDLLFSGLDYLVIEERPTTGTIIHTGQLLNSFRTYELYLTPEISVVSGGFVGPSNEFYFLGQNLLEPDPLYGWPWDIISLEDANNGYSPLMNNPFVSTSREVFRNTECAAFLHMKLEVAVLGTFMVFDDSGLTHSITDYSSNAPTAEEVWHYKDTYKLDGTLDSQDDYFHCNDMAGFGSQWIAVGSENALVRVSNDGNSWPVALEGPPGLSLTAIDRNNSVVVAVGVDENNYSTVSESVHLGVIYYSLDGVNWTQVSDPDHEFTAFNTVAASPFEVIALTNPSAERLVTFRSTDGINWSAFDVIDTKSNLFAPSVTPVRVLWDGYRFVMLTIDGDIYTYSP